MSTNWIAARLRPRPSLAEQAASDLRAAIRAGAFGASGQLPSEPTLSRQLGVSRPTVRHALSLLEQHGLIVRRQGLGTFVLTPVAELAALLNTNSGVTEMIRAAGLRPGTAQLRAAQAAAPPAVATHLGIAAGSPVAVIERVRTADDKPVAFTRDFLPSNLLLDHDVAPDHVEAFVQSEGGSLYEALSVAGLPIEYGIAKVLPAVADGTIASTLGVDRDTQVILLEQTDYAAGGVPVLFAEEYLLPSALSVYAYRRGPG